MAVSPQSPPQDGRTAIEVIAGPHFDCIVPGETDPASSDLDLELHITYFQRPSASVASDRMPGSLRAGTAPSHRSNKGAEAGDKSEDIAGASNESWRLGTQDRCASTPIESSRCCWATALSVARIARKVFAEYLVEFRPAKRSSTQCNGMRVSLWPQHGTALTFPRRRSCSRPGACGRSPSANQRGNPHRRNQAWDGSSFGVSGIPTDRVLPQTGIQDPEIALRGCACCTVHQPANSPLYTV